MRALRAWLREREQRRDARSPYLFLSERGPMVRQAVNYLVTEIGKRAKLRFHVHPHMLRHSTGYYLANRGYDTRLVQDYLGHIKRVDKRLVGYLTRPEIEALLAAPDRTQWIGRGQALLLTFYNSGARLSELTTLRQNQVNFGASAFLNLMGKGRKQRTVPLWPKTARVLQSWFRELEKLRTDWAFPNMRGSSLSSDGVNYILQQAVRRAAVTCPGLQGKHVTPHMLRHYVSCRTMSRKTCPESRDPLQERLWLGRAFNFTRHSLNP